MTPRHPNFDTVGIICRPAQPEDAAAIIHWFPDRATIVAWAGEATPEPLTAAWLASEIEHPAKHHYTLVAPNCGIVGFFCLLPFPEEHRAHLTRVGVAPDSQGLGIGRRIVTECLRAARDDLGAHVLTLSVYTSNKRAFEIYVRAGFKRADPQPTPQDIPDPLVRMEFPL